MKQMTDTDCRKCGSAMCEPPPAKALMGIFAFTVTAYRCKNCDHWNDLKKRKKNKDMIEETK